MDITAIVQAVVGLIFAVIGTVLIPCIRERIGADRYERAERWVTAAVSAAEQIYRGSGRGKEKKEYVLAFLEARGLQIDLDALDAMIEAAVLELNYAKKDEG